MYRTFEFSGEWTFLKQQLGKGRPLIAALKPSSSRELHYVVVAGLDEEHKLVLLNDLAQRKLLKGTDPDSNRSGMQPETGLCSPFPR
jgi:hypothetical protein